MDYYSVLGPIDPQILDSNGKQLLPGVGYLRKYKELVKQINESESAPKAELAFLIKKFDPAMLFHIEQSIDHGISLVTQWLPKYKFKDWDITESEEEVILEMKVERAKKIAQILGDTQKWHSHGRGISMKELSGEDIKLKIDDFGADKALSNLIRHYHGLCVDFYSAKSGLND